MSRLSDTIDQAQSQIAARILSLTAANPLVSYKEVAKQVGCSEDFVQSVMKRAGFARRPGRKPKAVK
jgi:hypothetical protein